MALPAGPASGPYSCKPPMQPSTGSESRGTRHLPAVDDGLHYLPEILPLPVAHLLRHIHQNRGQRVLFAHPIRGKPSLHRKRPAIGTTRPAGHRRTHGPATRRKRQRALKDRKMWRDRHSRLSYPHRTRTSRAPRDSPPPPATRNPRSEWPPGCSALESATALLLSSAIAVPSPDGHSAPPQLCLLLLIHHQQSGAGIGNRRHQESQQTLQCRQVRCELPAHKRANHRQQNHLPPDQHNCGDRHRNRIQDPQRSIKLELPFQHHWHQQEKEACPQSAGAPWAIPGPGARKLTVVSACVLLVGLRRSTGLVPY